MSRNYNCSNDYLKALLTRPKYILDDVRMERHQDREVYTCDIHLVYCTNTGDSFAGLSIQLESKRSLNNYIYHSFMLSYRRLKTQNIILQIEVEPFDKKSHVESDGRAIFGSHVHTLGDTDTLRDNTQHWNWHNWLSEFSKRAIVDMYGNRIPPFDGELLL